MGTKDARRVRYLILIWQLERQQPTFKIRLDMKDYDYLSLIVEISPQKQVGVADRLDYERCCRWNEYGFYTDILDYMKQWDYGEDTSATQKELDKYEEVLVETNRYILARCESKYFGWQGDAFFLYRKDKNK